MQHRFLFAFSFVVSLVVNPTAGCSSNETSSQWQYDESEMEHAVVGTYSGTVTLDGSTEPVTLIISRPPAPSGATPARFEPQCGSRTFFVKPAGACVSMSTMPLQGELSSTGPLIASGHLTGQFIAFYALTGQLALSDAGGARLSASYADGHFSEWTYSAPDGGVVPLDLERR
jgi:hypothetical protein